MNRSAAPSKPIYNTYTEAKSQSCTDTGIAWWHLALALGFLSGVTLVLYLPTIHYGFVFDDLPNILKYFNIRHATFKTTFFSSTRWISYWINALYYYVGGFNPTVYRLGNISFHVVTGLLVFGMLYSLFSRLPESNKLKAYAFIIASYATALFLCHPVQSQTVSYAIQGQLEGLAGLTIIACVFCFTRLCYAPNKYAKSIWAVLLYVIAFISCGTKEIAIVTPALVLLVDWFFIAQGSWTAIKSRALIHGCLWVLIFGIYIYLLKPTFFLTIIGLKAYAHNNIGNTLTSSSSKEIISPLLFCISQFKVLLHYGTMFFWPFTISGDYDWKLVDSFFALDCLVPLSILIALMAYTAKRLYRNNTDIVGFCVLWFLVCTIPRSSIIASSELLADYKTYTASVGVLLAIAVGLVISISALVPSPRSKIYALGLLLLTSVLGYATYSRNHVWSSQEAFWSDVIKKAPGRARAYNNYAVALIERGQFAEALPYLDKALELDNSYPDPWNNKAVIYAAQQEIDQAIVAIKHSLRISPYQPEGYNNLGTFFLDQRDYDQAEQAFTVALKLKAHYGKARYNLGRTYLAQNKVDAAYQCFKQACMQDDFDTDLGFAGYAAACLKLGYYAEAISAYHKALSKTHNPAPSLAGLAQAYCALQDYAKALEVYQKLAQLTPQDGRVWHNMGQAYARIGNSTQAQLCAQRAQRLLNS